MTRRNALVLTVACPSMWAAIIKTARVETAFRSPGPHPNGLQATSDGLWILDQGDNRAYLVSYADGTVLRTLETDSKAGSGITFDGEALWLASTYSREIIRADARTGKTLAKFPTPGAGVVHWTAKTGRRSPLAPAPPPVAKSAVSDKPGQATGAHGLEWKDGRLWIAVPPAQKIYKVNPTGWMVEQQFASAGDRPHGLGWQGDWLWCTDSNLNAFFRHDVRTGKYDKRIQLADTDPLPHGMTIWQDTLWYCDDVGVICRLKMP